MQEKIFIILGTIRAAFWKKRKMALSTHTRKNISAKREEMVLPATYCAATIVNRQGKNYLQNAFTLILLLLIVQIAFASPTTKSVDNIEESDRCCTSENRNNHFCEALRSLSVADQRDLLQLLNCQTQQETATVEKRKPNFIRYGRSLSNLKRLSEPNFLRSARSSEFEPENLASMFEKKSANGVSANFLRFGKSASDPNFLRFGKRSTSPILGAATESAEPNFLRFGRQPDNNFLRFGKRDQLSDDNSFGGFNREYRKPNFLRFG